MTNEHWHPVNLYIKDKGFSPNNTVVNETCCSEFN